jgi:hypothetical protein
VWTQSAIERRSRAPIFPDGALNDGWTIVSIKLARTASGTGRRFAVTEQDTDCDFPGILPDPSNESGRYGAIVLAPSGSHTVGITGFFRNA